MKLRNNRIERRCEVVEQCDEAPCGEEEEEEEEDVLVRLGFGGGTHRV